MRHVDVESTLGWVDSLAGFRMAVDGVRFTTHAVSGKEIVYERRDGTFSRPIGMLMVHAQAFLEDHLNRPINTEPPVDIQ